MYKKRSEWMLKIRKDHSYHQRERNGTQNKLVQMTFWTQIPTHFYSKKVDWEKRSNMSEVVK